MEVTGLTVGAVSLFALFSTAIEGYRFIKAVAGDLPADSPFLVTKFQIEAYRFGVWGEYLGFTESEGCEFLLQQSLPTQTIVLAVLTEVATTMADLDSLKTKYGLKAIEIVDPVELEAVDMFKSPAIINIHTRFKAQIKASSKVKKL